MDGKKLSTPRGRAPRGRLHLRKRGRIWHVDGTIRIGQRAESLRRSLGIDTEAPGSKELAEAERIRLEREILDRLLRNQAPPRLFAELARDYVTKRDPGPADLANLEELLLYFGPSRLDQLTRETIESFYDARFREAAPATRRRHENTLAAVLNHGVRAGILPMVPYWSKARPKARRGAAAGRYFQGAELARLIAFSAPHARPLFATLAVTGARVGSVIYLPRESFVLMPGRGRVFFPKTKNGRAYDRPLHDFALDHLRAWLESRSDSHPEMFLTSQGRPYVPKAGRGGQVRTAFGRARDRLVAALEAAGDHPRARVLAEATPHWFRHNLANRLRLAGASLPDIMAAGGWESPAPVLQNYLVQAPAHVEAQLRGLDFERDFVAPAALETFGTDKTQSPACDPKKTGKTGT